jgi:hypothetical protein
MQNRSTVHGHLGPLGLEREHAGALRLVGRRGHAHATSEHFVRCTTSMGDQVILIEPNIQL